MFHCDQRALLNGAVTTVFLNMTLQKVLAGIYTPRIFLDDVLSEV